MAEAGGLETLLIEQHEDIDGATALMVTPADSDQPPMPAKLFGAPWAGDDAHVLLFTGPPGLPATDLGARGKEASLALRTVEARSRELAAILDTATDGVVVIDG